METQPLSDRIITADASKVSPSEFLNTVGPMFGFRPRAPRDRALEAEYHEALNAHWTATKAAMAAMQQREGEGALAFTIRKMELLNEHEAWRREQAAAWANGTWRAPAAETARAA